MTCILLIILVALFFVYMQSLLFFGEFALFYSWPVQKAIQCLKNSHHSNLGLHTKYFFFLFRAQAEILLFQSLEISTCSNFGPSKSHLVTGIFLLFYSWHTQNDFGEFSMFYIQIIQRIFWRITLIHFLIYIQRHLISKFHFFLFLAYTRQ